MAPTRSRASSAANPRSTPLANAPKQTPKQQRPRRGSAHVPVHSPTSTPSRPTKPARTAITPTAPTPEPSGGDVGMTPADRYYKNLRVLRRRDPHIVSIFDQFAHVTVYYMQDDLTMERAGYEGTLFFFERNIEPRYGLFILNRQGMFDYIRYLLHDDVVEPMGDAIWISTLTPTSRNAMGDEDKTAGFWSMATDVRETLGDMVMRLAACVRRGERYPDEFRYGPDRVVPQQNYFAGGTRDDVKHDFLRDLPDGMREKIIQTVHNAKAKAHAEEEDAATVNGKSVPKTVPPSQSSMSELDQLFFKLSTSEVARPDPTPPALKDSLSGKALLDTMFASVSTTVAQQPNQAGQKLTLQQLGLAPPVTSPPESMEIISPKPSAAGLPQILTADVIHGLMGLPTPESRSASRSSASASVLDHPRSPSSTGAHRSRERGYIADYGEDEGGTSEASTNVDLDNSTAGESILERLLPGARSSFLSAPSNGSSGSLKGDATPRARIEQLGHISPPIRSRPAVTQTASEAQVQTIGVGASYSANRKSVPQKQQTASRTVSAPSTVRAPFQSASELWPTGEPHDTSGIALSSDDMGAGADEVVELDFSEISVLDDIRALEVKSKVPSHVKDVKKNKDNEKGRVNGVVISMPIGQHAKAAAANHANLTARPSANAPAEKREHERNGVKPSASTPDSQVFAHAQQDIAGRSFDAALADSELVTQGGQLLSRNAFVREVLTLIHTDKNFVDKMYQTYQEATRRTG